LVPIEPDAPGWLTTTIFWPSTFSISAAVMRVTWSVEPPAAHGTIRLIGLVGFHCAHAGAAANRQRRPGRPAVLAKVRRCMDGVWMCCVAAVRHGR
jgi:hypothetical protein